MIRELSGNTKKVQILIGLYAMLLSIAASITGILIGIWQLFKF